MTRAAQESVDSGAGLIAHGRAGAKADHPRYRGGTFQEDDDELGW